MSIALKDLKLKKIAVVYPGTKRYPLSLEIEAVPLREAVAGVRSLFSK